MSSHVPGAQPTQGAAAVAPMSDDQIALLTLRFDENEFGYLPPDPVTGGYQVRPESAVAPTGQHSINSAFVPYSEHDFVKEKQEHMSLEDLQTDLGTYARLLENKIMQHIHEDVHEAFVTVSGQLVGMTDPLAKALQPLQAARKRLHGSLQHLEGADSEVTESMAAARRAEVGRQFQVTVLQLFLSHESACRTYSELSSVQEGMHLVMPPGLLGAAVSSTKGAYTVRPVSALAAPGSGGHQLPTDEANLKAKQWGSMTDIERHDGLVEDLAQQIMRMRALWASLPHVASFCHSPASVPPVEADAVNKRVEEAVIARREAFELLDEANRSLHLALGTATYDAYLATFSISDTSSAIRRFSQLLRVYKLLGDEQELSVMYRDIIVRPMVEAVVSWKAVGEARKSTAVVTQILSNIKHVLTSKVLQIVPLLRDTFGDSIHPVSDIVWSAVCDTLVKRMMFLFSPALPDVFHANFAAAQELLSLLEGQCETTQELYALRNSGDMPMWVRKWNLDVYHVQRTQELTDAFDKLFSNTSLFTSPSMEPVTVAPTNTAQLTANASTLDLGGNLYAYHYAAAFEGLGELALRILGRRSFLHPLAARQMKLALTQLHNGLQRIESEAVRAATDGPSYIPLCYLLHDLTVFESFIKNDFVQVAKATLGEQSPQQQQQQPSPPSSPTGYSANLALGNLLKLAVTCVADKRKKVTQSIHDSLLEAACVPLDRALSTAANRSGLANAPWPTEPSRQLEDTVAVFNQFAQLAAKVISREEVHSILAGVGVALCVKHQGAVISVLQGSWRRLKAMQKVRRVANTGASPGASDNADFDKLVLLLYIDTSFLEEQLPQYLSSGMAGSDATVYQHYFRPLVMRGKWIVDYRQNANGTDEAPPMPALWPEVNEV